MSSTTDETLRADTTIGGAIATLPRTGILFIDTGVEGYEGLVAGAGPGVEVVLIDHARDGLGQVAAALAGRAGVDAVHVIGHGANGTIALGASLITEASLPAYADELATIRAALSENADLLLYGCAVGADAGLLRALAEATGADVAASTDLTGAARRGGDWQLEAQLGVVESTALTYDDGAFDGTLGLLTLSPSDIPSNTNIVTKDGYEMFFSSTLNGSADRVAQWNSLEGGISWNYFDQDSRSFVFRRVDGTAFDMNSIGIKRLDLSSYADTFIRGYNAGNAKIAETIVPKSYDYGGTGLEIISLGSSFDVNVTKIVVSSGFYLAPSMNVFTFSFNNFDVPLAAAAPTVTGVSAATANGAYNAGDTISIQVSFSQAVAVTGAPQLTLETGTIDRVATYAGGNGTSTLTFTYTVQAGDTSADLDYISTSALALAGGTIKSGGTDATLTLAAPGAAGSLGANKALVIDTTAPAAPGFGTVAGDGVINAAERTSGVTLSGTTEAGSTVSLSIGGQTRAASVTGTSWSYTLVAGDYTNMGQGAETISATATDAAGNTSTSGSTSITVDTVVPATPGVSLASDTGTSNSDLVTKTGTVNVTGLEGGATWEYSTDNGSSWNAGTGSSFTLPVGGYASGHVRVRQTDAAGNASTAGTLGAVTVDTSVAAPGLVLAFDTGTSGVDGITKSGTVNVTGLEAGGSWEFSTDGGTGWTAGTGSSFTLNEGSYTSGQVRVRQTDLAGNLSGAGSLGAATVDSSVATPTLALAFDTGASNGDDVTSDGTVNVGGIEAGAGWEYSTNSGSSWTAGTGSSFTLPAGSYGSGQVRVRQTDTAGNTSAEGSFGAVRVDGSAATPTLTLASDTGASGVDGITKTGTVTVTGIESGATWEYSTDNGSSWNAGTGSSFTLAAGAYTAGHVQVRQTDLAGNLSGTGSLGAVTVDATAPGAPGAALASDTGASSSDGVTSDGTVNVTGLDGGAAWEYSTDNGSSWNAGTGTSFTLAAGAYAAGHVQVRQTDLAGNTGSAGSLGAVTVDGSAAAPGLALASDTGASSSDGITQAGTVTVTGIESGAAWEYSTDSGSSWNAGTGSSFTLAAGAYSAGQVRVRQTDLAGNTSSNGSLGAVTIDGSAPAAPGVALTTDSGSSNSDGITQTGTVDVTGIEAGAAWEYSTDNGSSWNAGTGSSFTLAAGAYAAGHVQVRQTDLAGNTGSTGSLGAVTVDSSAAAPGLALASDTGASNSDGITQTGTVNVAGIESGATWEYSTDNGSSWNAGTGSSFTLAAGAYSAGQVRVRQTDLAGNTSSAGSLGAVAVDASAPSAPGLALASDTGASGVDGITQTGTVDVTGIEAGAAWEYSTDNGTSWNAGTGVSFTLAAGVYTAGHVQVRQADLAGNTGSTGSLGAVTVDSSAAAPGVALTTDTGSSNSDGITQTGTVDVTGIEAGAAWEYSTDNGSSWNAGTGSSFTLSAGAYTAGQVRVRQTDLAGNTGSAGSLGAVTVDSSAAAPGLALASDTGTSGVDGITQAGAVNVTGIESGASWEYSTDNGTNWNAGTGSSFTLTAGVYSAGQVRVRQTDLAGNTSSAGSLGAVTVDGSAALPTLVLATDTGASSSDGVTTIGTVDVTGIEAGAAWEYSTDNGSSWNAGTGTSFTLAQGAYTAGQVQVRQTDVAGNFSSVGSLGAVTVDGSAPSAPGLALASDTGTSGVDGITQAGTVNVTGVEAGASWEYSTDNGTSWNAGTGSSFTLAAGAYSAGHVQVRQTDLAGNTGSAGSLGAVSVDASAPSAPALALATDSGASNSDGITQAGTVDVTGVEAGASWEYSTDNGTSWNAGTGTSFMLAAGAYAAGQVRVRQTDLAGNTSSTGSLGAVTVDGSAVAPTPALASDTGASNSDGITNTGTVTVTGIESGATWEYSTDNGSSWNAGTGSSFTLAAGVYTSGHVQVRQTDLAGNTGSTGSLGAVTVDASAPSAPSLALASDTGASNSDGITQAGTVDVTGVEAGASWEYSTDNGSSWNAGTGSSFTLAAGVYLAGQVQLRQTDAAGNTGGTGSLGAVTVDAAAPTPPGLALALDAGASNSDGITKLGTVDVTGLESGAAWEYSTDNGTSWNAGTGSSFTLAAGVYLAGQVQVRQADLAGNSSSTGSLGAVTVDAAAPAVPGLALALDTGISSSDGVTNIGTVTVTGIESGAAWEYSTDNGTNWNGGTGAIFTLAAGVYGPGQVQVRQTDLAGNTGGTGFLDAVTVDDSAAPPTLALAIDTGASSNDGVTNTGTVDVIGLESGALWEYSTDDGTSWTAGTGSSFTLAAGVYLAGQVQVRQIDPAGNPSAEGALDATEVDLTPPGEPVIGAVATDDVVNAAEATAGVTISGTTEADTTVSVLVGGQVRTATVSGTSWSYTLVAADLLAAGEGPTTISATATDAAGNTGGAGTRDITIDTVAPAEPFALLLAPDSDSGMADGEVTNDTTPTIGGEAEAGGLVTLYDTDGTTVLGTATAGVDGTWLITSGTLGEGDHTLLARTADAAGNASAAAALQLVIDLTAPGAPVVAGLAPASDTGVPGDNVTTRTTPTITGTAEAGALVTLYDTDGTTVLGTGSAGVDGTWSVASATLALGDHDLVARATDAAGNASGLSDSILVSIASFDLPPIYVTGEEGSGQVKASLYEGPVDYLVYAFIGSEGGEAVLSTSENDFLNLQGGDDAADGGQGDDVLDGGTGSNFLTGGGGMDVYFLDGRNGETTWSTITDWQQGEQLSIWGWRPGVSRTHWVDNDGAEGYKGVTLHADLDGNGVIDTSVTWAGLTRADLPTPTQQDGLLWFH
jgi:hypothetical protein